MWKTEKDAYRGREVVQCHLPRLKVLGKFRGLTGAGAEAGVPGVAGRGKPARLTLALCSVVTHLRNTPSYYELTTSQS